MAHYCCCDLPAASLWNLLTVESRFHRANLQKASCSRASSDAKHGSACEILVCERKSIHIQVDLDHVICPLEMMMTLQAAGA